MKDLKSQVSIEFLVTLSIILVISIVIGYLFYHKLVIITDIKKEIVAKRIIRGLAENMNDILMVGSGHSHQIILPKDIYGGGKYEIYFHNDEPSIFIKSGKINWFAPIFTQRIGCTMKRCKYKGNTTNILIENITNIRISNILNSVCLQDNLNYNLKQGKNEWRIIPFRGKMPKTTFPNVTEESEDSIMYLYLNEDTGTISLVFRHGMPGDGGGTVNIDFHYDGHKPSKTIFTISGTLTPSMGHWTWTSGPAGGALEFNPSCIYMRITVDGMTEKWYWINADGSKIKLDNSPNTTLYIIYP